MEIWLRVKTSQWPAQAGAGKSRTRLKSCLDLWKTINMIYWTGRHSAFSDSVLYKEDLFSWEARWKGHHRRLQLQKHLYPQKTNLAWQWPFKCSALHEINEEDFFFIVTISLLLPQQVPGQTSEGFTQEIIWTKQWQSMEKFWYQWPPIHATLLLQLPYCMHLTMQK